MRFRGKTRDKRQRHARNRVEKMEPRACESSFFLPLMGSGRTRNIRFGIIERWQSSVRHRPVLLRSCRTTGVEAAKLSSHNSERECQRERERGQRMKLKYRLARASNASNRNRPRSVAMHRSGIFDSRSLLRGTITIYIRVYIQHRARGARRGSEWTKISVHMGSVGPSKTDHTRLSNPLFLRAADLNGSRIAFKKRKMYDEFIQTSSSGEV